MHGISLFGLALQLHSAGSCALGVSPMAGEVLISNGLGAILSSSCFPLNLKESVPQAMHTGTDIDPECIDRRTLRGGFLEAV